MSNEDHPCQSTPADELERRITDPGIPKNEQEHWAANEIHRLRDLLNGGCPSHPKPTLAIDDQLIEAVRIVSEAGLSDAAEWIKRKVMAQTDRLLADIDASVASEPIAITQFAVSPALCGAYLYATVPPGIRKSMSRCANQRPCAIHSVTNGGANV